MSSRRNRKIMALMAHCCCNVATLFCTIMYLSRHLAILNHIACDQQISLYHMLFAHLYLHPIKRAIFRMLSVIRILSRCFHHVSVVYKHIFVTYANIINNIWPSSRMQRSVMYIAQSGKGLMAANGVMAYVSAARSLFCIISSSSRNISGLPRHLSLAYHQCLITICSACDK